MDFVHMGSGELRAFRGWDSHTCVYVTSHHFPPFFILSLPSVSGVLSSVSLNTLYCKENFHPVHLGGHTLNDALCLKEPVELVGTLTLLCIISSRKALTWLSLVLCYLFHWGNVENVSHHYWKKQGKGK